MDSLDDLARKGIDPLNWQARNMARMDRIAATVGGSQPLHVVNDVPASRGAERPHLDRPAVSTRLVTKPVERVTTVDLIPASSIQPEAIRWIWPGFLAAGKLHIIAGDPGTGKTTLAIALAAIVSAGGYWPDRVRAQKGRVLIWSGEDGKDDTLVPRLMVAGADLSMVSFVGMAKESSETIPFDPARHVPALVHAAVSLGDIAMIIVDPIVSAIAGDSHKGAEVRRGLQPLVDAADKLGAAVVGITHFSKSTAGRKVIDRVTGSHAFGAVARVVMGTAKLPEDEGGARVLFRAKSNIGLDDGGFRYELLQDAVPGLDGISASRVNWLGSIEGSAQEILAVAEAPLEERESGAVEAQDWLTNLLEDEGGKMNRRDVMTAARTAGFSERTMHRAREKLGVEAIQTGFGRDRRSTWQLPLDPIRATNSHACHSQKAGMNGTYGTHGQELDDAAASPQPVVGVQEATDRSSGEV